MCTPTCLIYTHLSIYIFLFLGKHSVAVQSTTQDKVNYILIIYSYKYDILINDHFGVICFKVTYFLCVKCCIKSLLHNTHSTDDKRHRHSQFERLSYNININIFNDLLYLKWKQYCYLNTKSSVWNNTIRFMTETLRTCI